MSSVRRNRARALVSRSRPAPAPAPHAAARAERGPSTHMDSKAQRVASRPDWAAAAPPPFALGTSPMEERAGEAIQRKGTGAPMHGHTRGVLEARMGTDLGAVRVHDSPAARQAAADIGARAFTEGSDIWLGPGESQSDVALMAHEATHVVQQAGMVQRLIQRNGAAPGAPPGGGPAASGGAGAPLPLRIPRLVIPQLKVEQLPQTTNFTLGPPETRTNQSATWRSTVRPLVEARIDNLLQGKEGIRRDAATGEVAPDTDAATTANKTYFFHIGAGVGGGEQDQYVIGNRAQLIDELTIPRWDPQGRPRSLDVDHRRELQLGGAADAMENFWLLDSSANRSAGSRIRNAIATAVAEAARADARWSAPKTPAELHGMGVPIQIDEIASGGTLAGSPDSRWEYDKVANPDNAQAPFTKLTNLTAAQLRSAGLLGAPTRLVIYPVSGGRRKEVPGWDAARGQRGLWADFIRGIRQAEVRYQPGGGENVFSGLIEQRMRGRILLRKDVRAALTEVAGLPFTTMIDRADLSQSMRFAELNGLSPIEFSEVGIDAERGLLARGVLRPTLPILRRGIEIDIVLQGDDLQLSKTFTKDDFSFPGPITVTQAALTIGIGTESGLFADGTVDFEIPRLGRGQIGARASTGEGFELRGSFDFDSSLFDPARITAEYSDGRLRASGEIGIPAGRVRGIRSASLRVEIDGETVTATGTVRPQVPGVERGQLTVRYSPTDGLVISGLLELANNIPGIQGGTLTAEVTKRPDADRWSVTATGEVVPRIPGVATRLQVTYADGAVDANATVGYERGMLSGSVAIGATNRPIGPDGQPVATPPATEATQLRVYGGGSLTLRLAPWLQATAGVRILPNGEIEVSGEIGLPAALEIFPERRFDRNIFTIGIDIPIVGVAVAGQRIGIFANISGGLDLSAGIGPGQLTDLRLGVTYNPSREQETRITGGASLHIPAQAGLRLFVRGSLGVGIPIVSASAGIELGGQLGIEGALDAGVQVNWSPATGLDIQAQAEIYAQPVFRFDITGFVLVEADLVFTTIELYSQRWQLASFEYGSGLRLGLRFPIHYHEGEPFNISMSDVEFEIPDIDPESLLRGLIARIA